MKHMQSITALYFFVNDSSVMSSTLNGATNERKQDYFSTKDGSNFDLLPSILVNMFTQCLVVVNDAQLFVTGLVILDGPIIKAQSFTYSKTR
jgi:hypothetical protein